jgi:secreted trypsin-like serine protease
MKVASVAAGLGISLSCLFNLVTSGYGQSASAQGSTITPEASAARQEALRANPQAAAIARGATGRIVGGEPVLIVDNPWQVALVRGFIAEPQRSQFCGGSIIGTDWVLTAAHCIRNTIVREDPSRVNVVVGTPQFFIGGERISVAAIHVHPQYNDLTNEFDFALLRVSRPVTTGGTETLVTGWGAVSEGGPGSLDLLGAQVPIVSTAVCNRPESYNGDITANMICAGREAGGIDSCQGDSGGPLSATLNGRRVLIGVVSFGEGCARRLKFGVYARVPVAAQWIASTTGTAGGSKK